MASCSDCKTAGVVLNKCKKCGNVWHCSQKPGRKGVASNVCEQCGTVGQYSKIQ